MVSFQELQRIEAERGLLDKTDVFNKRVADRTAHLQGELTETEARAKKAEENYQIESIKLQEAQKDAMSKAYADYEASLEAEKETQLKIREAEKVAAGQALRQAEEASRKEQARLQAQIDKALDNLITEKTRPVPKIQEQERQIVALNLKLEVAYRALSRLQQFAETAPNEVTVHLVTIAEELRMIGDQLTASESEGAGFVMKDLASRQLLHIDRLQDALNIVGSVVKQGLASEKSSI